MTDGLPIGRFPIPELADMLEDIRKRISRAFFAYHDAMTERPGPELKRLICGATSFQRHGITGGGAPRRAPACF